MIARKIRELLKLKLSIMLLSSLVLMAIIYLLLGAKGIEELIAGYNGNFQTPNLLHYSILFVIAIILWFFYYFFNYRNKEFLKKLSYELFNTCINLLRIASGVFISFTILHLCVDGWHKNLSLIICYGLIAFSEVTFFSYIRDYWFFKDNRNDTKFLGRS